MTDAYPIVIYHANCLDGFGAAFAAWTRYRDKADYVPLAYGDSTEVWLSRNRASLVGREVFVLDFSLPEEHMNFIRANAKKFVWLDHHKTAFEMERLMKSLVANAENNKDLDPETLWINEVYADEGITYKRFQPKARGRVGRINKRTCSITVVAEDRGGR